MKQIPLSPALCSSVCHSSGILEGDEPGHSLARWSSGAGTGKHHCQGQRSGSVLTLYSRGPRLTLSHDVRNRFSEALAYTPPDFSSLCVRQPPMFIHVVSMPRGLSLGIFEFLYNSPARFTFPCR